MTSDIVERLRAYASDDHERGCQGRCYDCSCGYDGKRDPLLEDAATRIERLEAALHAWNAACHIDPMMEGPRFRGVSPILAQKACLLTIAALEDRT